MRETRLRIFQVLAAGTMFAFSMGCSSGGDTIGSLSEPLSLSECDRDSDCDRGEFCAAISDEQSACSNGVRCDSSRECDDGFVCRGDGYHCFAAERDRGDASDRRRGDDEGDRARDRAEDRETDPVIGTETDRSSDRATDRPTDREDARQCPRGSFNGYVLCAPGFENVVVSRRPHCETCEPRRDLLSRCRDAGLSARRCRAILGGGDSPDRVLHRCREAGVSQHRCRTLIVEDDRATSWDRCRVADVRPDRCRAIFTDENDDRAMERCRAADIPADRCRDLLN